MPRARRQLSFLIAVGLAMGTGLGCSGGSPGSGADLAARDASAKRVSGSRSGGDVSAKADAAVANGNARAKQELPRKIIYTGQVSLACEDLDRAIDGLEKAVRSVGGYVGDANRSGERNTARTASYTVRVASDRFDAFLKSLPGLGEFESATRTAQDVSEEFYDADARLKNKRVEEARLVELIRRVAGNLDQILRVESELSRVREEIEQIEGRLRFLAHQTDLSTVTVNLREVKNFVPEGPPTFSTRVRRTWTGSLDALTEFGTGLILFVVGVAPWLVPLLIVGGTALLIVRRVRRPRPPIVPTAQGSTD